MAAITDRGPPICIDINGHVLHLQSGADPISECLSANKVWEPFETYFLSQVVRGGDTVVDLGANIGYFTVLLAKLVGTHGVVYAFEPDPGNFALLEKNISSNGCRNVTAAQQAVSNVTGHIRLYRAESDPGDNRIYDSHDGRSWITVKSTRLDDFFAGKRDSINLIKMDIQGAEAAAMEGMSSLLEANRDVNILLEYWPVGLQRCGAAPRELLERLLSRGFALYELQNEGVEPARPEELLRKYTVESRKYTNLYCTRRPQSWLELNDLWLDQFQGGWWKKLRDATRRLSALIPPGEKFILVDDARLGDDCLLPDRTAIPFNERNGVFWGPPRDDEEAIAEFRRLLNTGAGFLVFAWPSYWWLEHYKQLAELVRVRFPCIVEDESLVVFDLRGMTAKLAAAYAAELDA